MHWFYCLLLFTSRYFALFVSICFTVQVKSVYALRSSARHPRSLLLGCVQTDATTPNIVAPTTLGVVPCVLAVVCKRMQQLPTMLGPAVHRVTSNNVGSFLPTMLRPFAHPVACCWMLLRVVVQSLKPVKLFSQQLPNISFVPWSPKRLATMLDPFAQLFQHCWSHARSLRMVYKELWAVSFPRCTAGPSIVGSCCVRLHAVCRA